MPLLSPDRDRSSGHDMKDRDKERCDCRPKTASYMYRKGSNLNGSGHGFTIPSLRWYLSWSRSHYALFLFHVSPACSRDFSIPRSCSFSFLCSHSFSFSPVPLSFFFCFCFSLSLKPWQVQVLSLQDPLLLPLSFAGRHWDNRCWFGWPAVSEKQ